jgi:hypothetical protein
MSKISKEQMQRTEAWHKKAFALLQGQKIETILWKQWDEDNTTGLVLVLDSGTALFIAEDDEGNGPGAIHWSTGRANTLKVDIGGNETVMVEPHGILPVGVMETARWREEEINQEVEANKQMIANKVDEINNLANEVEGVTNG